MKPEITVTMIARAAGLVLIVLGATSLLSLLPTFQEPPMASAGWTSYSPQPPSTPTPVPNLITQLESTYFVVAHHTSFWLPSMAQALAGVVFILFSKSIGKWLAKGLGDGEKAEG
jgi:heme/copper-type cytochrome/quinol oxidase subunit 1